MKALRCVWDAIYGFRFELVVAGAVLGALAAILLAAAHDSRQALQRTDSVILIDGCQYIEFRTYYGYIGVTHKGNCTNRIHDYNR